MPQILIDTYGHAIQRRDRVTAEVTVAESSSAPPKPDSSLFKGRAGVAIRGSGSTIFPKKSYRLELIGDHGRDNEESLLGMPEESDWILLASYNDKTLMRDLLAYELWRAMGYYAPRARHVELFVRTNAADRPHPGPLVHEGGEAWVFPGWPLSPTLSPLVPRGEREEKNTDLNYGGVYILVEKIKRGRERLNISRLKPDHDREPQITGGYIFKKDRLNPGEKGFTSSSGIEFAFEEPKERDITPDQAQWLTNFVNEFERVLFSAKFRDPTNGYAKYIDVDSFIDYHWLIEMSKNVDAHWFSQFFHKDREGKLKAGPVWDWDAAFGNAGYLFGKRTNGWRWEQVKGSYYAWYDRLFEDDEFLQRYIDRWSELRTTVFAASNLFARIDGLAKELAPAAARNYQRWHPANDATDTNRSPANRFQNEVNRMKSWIEGRLAWIDSQEFPKPVAQTVRDEPSGPPKVPLAWLTGRLFYTTNGTDPRAPGGGVASAAREYAGPIAAFEGAVTTARVQSDFGLWSAPVRIGQPARPESK